MRILVVVLVLAVSYWPAAAAQEVPECPPVDDTNDTLTLLPNPYNCSTFYYCAQGQPTLFLCPLGLEFNVEEKVCDYKERANCVQLELTTLAPVTEVVEAAETELAPVTEATGPKLVPVTEAVAAQTAPVTEAVQTKVVPVTEVVVAETKVVPVTEVVVAGTEVVPVTEIVPVTEVVAVTKVMPVTEAVPVTEVVAATKVVQATEAVPVNEAPVADNLLADDDYFTA